MSRDDGWSFPDDPVLRGIWIKDPPQGQFVLPDRQAEWKFKLHDKNDVKGTFRYGVRVVKGSIMPLRATRRIRPQNTKRGL